MTRLLSGLERGRVHPTALVSESAVLEDDVTVGAFSIINDQVVVGSGSVIGSHCVLGEPLAGAYEVGSDYVNPPLRLGARAVIRSGTILYAGAEIGTDFESGHRVTIREGSRIGNHCRIGTHSDVQGHCEIGDWVRLHSHVQVNHRSRIGRFAWLFPYVLLTNDPHPPSNTLAGVEVEEFAVLAARAVVLPGVRIGRDALVGANSLVRHDVAPESVVVGNPARYVMNVRDLRSRTTGEPIYPWRYHFDRGLPWAGIGYDAWEARQPQ